MLPYLFLGKHLISSLSNIGILNQCKLLDKSINGIYINPTTWKTHSTSFLVFLEWVLIPPLDSACSTWPHSKNFCRIAYSTFDFQVLKQNQQQSSTGVYLFHSRFRCLLLAITLCHMLHFSNWLYVAPLEIFNPQRRMFL